VFVGQVMIASRCPRRPARAARWPHPPRAARALGPPRRWRVEARDAQRPGETRRYRWGCPDPAPSVTAPRIRGTSNAAQDSIHRPVEGAPGARLTRSTGRRSARWATAAGRAAAAGKAAAGWRAVPTAAPARRPVPPAAGGVLLRSRVLLPRLFPRALPTRPVLLGHRSSVPVVGTDDRLFGGSVDRVTGRRTGPGGRILEARLPRAALTPAEGNPLSDDEQRARWAALRGRRGGRRQGRRAAAARNRSGAVRRAPRPTRGVRARRGARRARPASSRPRRAPRRPPALYLGPAAILLIYARRPERRGQGVKSGAGPGARKRVGGCCRRCRQRRSELAVRRRGRASPRDGRTDRCPWDPAAREFSETSELSETSLTSDQTAAGREPELAYYLCAGPPGTHQRRPGCSGRWAVSPPPC
jgi:hypothetical protein